MTAQGAPGEMQMNIEAARRRRARMAEEKRLNKMMRVLVTPEGAKLHLKLATAAERMSPSSGPSSLAPCWA